MKGFESTIRDLAASCPNKPTETDIKSIAIKNNAMESANLMKVGAHVKRLYFSSGHGFPYMV